MKKNKIKTCVSFDPDVIAALDEISKQTSVSKSDIVNALVRDAYKENKEITIRLKWRDGDE